MRMNEAPKTMILHDVPVQSFFKFNNRTTINWYVAYNNQGEDPRYVEIWANTGTELVITPYSKTWDKEVIILTRDEVDKMGKPAHEYI